MKNFIMGTAGHVDHGKTELVRKLTNIDCDTHPEEKRRGITINLGFAHLNLSNDIKLGIVDVPGHKDFVNTMVAGASGIDFVMFVIAANSGIMPQTIEHLKIIDLLGIKKGVVVLTKIDLVDKEIIGIMRTEVIKFLSNTILHSTDIVEVSSLTGFGIQRLLKSINKIIGQIERINYSSNFRMYIDRSFSIKGHGSVVTGSAMGGELNQGDNVWILPQNKNTRVRRIEQYGNKINSISEVSRISLNLAGLNIGNLNRGSVVSKNYLKPTSMIDAKIILYQKKMKLGVWSNAIFLIGTFQNPVRIHLIDRDKLRFGEIAIVQIHLSEPGIILRGDKFIVRGTSGEITLGGGEVIDAHPLHHRRRPKKLIEQLKRICNGGIIEFIENEINKYELFMSMNDLLQLLNTNVKMILEAVESQSEKNILIVGKGEDLFLIKKSKYEVIKNKILSLIERFHKKNRLLKEGLKIEELFGKLKIERNTNTENIIRFCLADLELMKKIKKINNTWALNEHKVTLSTTDNYHIKIVDDHFKSSRMHVPLSAELKDIQKRLQITDEKMKHILNFLSSKRRLYFFEGCYVHANIVDECRIKLLEHLSTNEQGITVAEFRDLIQGNRKICILLMNIYDSERFTIRNGNIRKITSVGKKMINNHE